MPSTGRRAREGHPLLLATAAGRCRGTRGGGRGSFVLHDRTKEPRDDRELAEAQSCGSFVLNRRTKEPRDCRGRSWRGPVLLPEECSAICNLVSAAEPQQVLPGAKRRGGQFRRRMTGPPVLPSFYSPNLRLRATGQKRTSVPKWSQRAYFPSDGLGKSLSTPPTDGVVCPSRSSIRIGPAARWPSASMKRSLVAISGRSWRRLSGAAISTSALAPPAAPGSSTEPRWWRPRSRAHCSSRRRAGGGCPRR